jgi:hypothetical protein
MKAAMIAITTITTISIIRARVIRLPPVSRNGLLTLQQLIASRIALANLTHICTEISYTIP